MPQPQTNGFTAYRRSATPKQMEAQVFSRVSHALREAEGPMARTRAKADAFQLWSAVLDCVSDPTNQLPAPLRIQIATLATAARRECNAEQGDLDFVAEVTEQVAAGLWG